MLDRKFIRQNPDAVRAALTAKNESGDLDAWLALDTEHLDLLRRWRDTDRKDDSLLDALFETVRGIARGMGNTG